MITNAPDDRAAIANLLRDHVNTTSINTIGKRGERRSHPMTNQEKFDRAVVLLDDYDRGYATFTGIPYGGLNTDAGHKVAFITNPALANFADNIEEEVKYVNTVKSGPEKTYGKLNMAPPDYALARALFNNVKEFTTDDVVLPGRAGSKQRMAYMAPINAKVAIV